ncbi:leucine ABC transporter subunit substrate-binding protein LivK [Thalassovita gelatinovora]|uniref:Leucine ABC transporter subunit substrate-binding protein LivK n=1 Tax=Thalassovita gelatinovora TaxID=53501 RepID=A0A0P1F626_THAGE|nr:ABC transporter substrate-binding protein [Thalassovita gelatinovora]QIZ80905.1 ABC transporter substrate-binding protein [Thalassovita gelatinovora]CUH63390.1 leucine ABC transporter subunit substrate-binding protein LivK [Thalassovita gelatinovora]SEQ66245.1 amino acid/amide ABC transporter substrate-binding protein, HAAT family [Thalassovita gelatinovora]
MTFDFTRRSVLLGAGAALGTFVLGRSQALAQATVPLKIGFISPVSGPLAGFGETDGYILDRAREALAGGVTMNGTGYSVELLDRDTQSDPSRAGQLARELINSDGVDIMIAVSTPETINPVSDACEAAGVPCISTVMPWEAWYFGRGAKPGEPSPFTYGFHFGFGVDEFYRAYISQWDLIETNRKVGVMYPNDADGNAVRAVLAPRLVEAGYEVIDPGAYETGTQDYSQQIRIFREAGIEIFNTFPIPPDFAAFWRQAAQQGLHRQIKIVQTAKTGLFPGDIEALGTLGNNIASAAYWHRDFPYTSPVTGLNGVALCDGYEAATGRQWTQQLGASLSAIDVAMAALAAAADPKDKDGVAAAIAGLTADSIAGVVDFTTGPVPNVAHGPIIGTQWQPSEKGPHQFDYVVTENATDPNVPVVGTLVPYNA